MLASVIIPFSASADDVLIKIYGAGNSSAEEFVLDEVKKLTFQDDYFTVMTFGGESRFFNYDETGRIVFTSVATGIAQVTPEGVSSIDISYDGSVLRITGCKSSAQLRIYDVTGRPVIGKTINGDTDISTENLPSGVYILKLNNRTFKFSR